MTEAKEELKVLAVKIDEISNQMSVLTENIQKLKKDYSGDKKNSVISNHHTFLTGLLLGIVTGVLGNLLVSSLMKIFDSSNPPLVFYLFIVVLLVLFFAILFLKIQKILESLNKK